MRSREPSWWRNRIAWAIASLAGILIAVIGGSLWPYNTQTDDRSIQSGHELAELLCVRCHALTAHGDSPNAAAPPFRTLLEKLTLEGIEDELTEGISLGHQPMPEWQFSGQQIYDLTSFISSIGE